MLGFDTNARIASLQGDTEADGDLINQALTDPVEALLPVTVTELLADPDLPTTLRRTIL